MSSIEIALERRAAEDSGRVALDDGNGLRVTRLELLERVRSRIRVFRGLGVGTLGIHCDNGIEWIVADLAAHVAGLPTVPLPKFFTRSQLVHVVTTAGIDTVVTDDAGTASDLGFDRSVTLEDGKTTLRQRDVDLRDAIPFQKITFTSGTTGTPKGVCLGREHLETIAAQLMEATGSLESDVHVCCLPLSVLLENVAGVLRSLLAGGRVVVPPLAEVGLVGAQQFDPPRALRAVRDAEATSAILVPEMLKGLVACAGDGPRTKLRYIGVGGARVSPSLLRAAHACGLPAYEGYGLSEFASVVAMNTPGESCIGASGKPLAHVRVRIAPDGEIQLEGPHFLGYLTDRGFVEPALTDDGFFPTGDLGEIDERGFVRVTGRKRNVLITSFGRNVSPEWVESEVLAHPLVADAVVYGDGAAQLSAVVAVRGDGAGIEEHLARVNAGLPDYARIGRCTVSRLPFSQYEGLVGSTGALLRDAIAKRFAGIPDGFDAEREKDTWAFTTGC